MQIHKSIGPTVAESFFSNIYDPTHRFSYRTCSAYVGTQHKCQVFFTLPTLQPPKFLRKNNCMILISFLNGFLESSWRLAAGNCKMNHE